MWKMISACGGAGLAVACVLMVSGCGKASRAPGIYIGETNKTIVAMSPDDVIVKVNGTAFTRGEYDLMLGGLEKTIRALNPGMNSTMLAMQKNQRARSLVPQFVSWEVILQDAARRGIKPSPTHDATAASPLSKAIGRLGVPSVAAMGTSSDAELRMVYNGARKQATVLAWQDAMFGDALTVTDEMVERSKRRLTAYNEQCAATNAAIMAQGAAIRARILAGEDFLKVAAEVTQDEEVPDGVWGEFVRAEIDDKKVANVAFTLPVGGVSEPLDTEEGLVIVKVLERMGIDSVAAENDATVKLGRILLLLGESIPEQSDDEIRGRIGQQLIEKHVGERIETLQRAAVIEYPNGTNFFSSRRSKK